MVLVAGTSGQWPFLAFLLAIVTSTLCPTLDGSGSIKSLFWKLRDDRRLQLRRQQKQEKQLCVKIKSEMAAAHSCFTKLEFLQKIIEKPTGGGENLLERFSKGSYAAQNPFRLITEEVSTIKVQNSEKSGKTLDL